MNTLAGQDLVPPLKWSNKHTMRRSSRSAVSYHAPKTEAFPDGSASEAAFASIEHSKSGNGGDFSSASTPQPHAPVSEAAHAVPLQRGPVGTFYQYPPSYPVASNKGMQAGEKHAVAAGFFVMFSLAAALGIGWWATLPPPLTVSGERPTPQAWAPVEKALAEPESSGSSGTAARPGKAVAAQEAMEAVSVDLPAVNEIRLSQPEAMEDRTSGAEAGPTPSDKSERTSGQAARDSRSEEVGRLKAKAYSETRRDRLGSSEPAKPSPKEDRIKRQPASLSDSISSSQSTDLRRALAKCNDEDGLFYRERCKWRLCNGQWGKYGCPSYGRNDKDEYPIS
jgi:hypothetical protein